MKKHIFYSLALALFIGSLTASAQEKETKSLPKVAKFITFGFKPIEFLNNRFNLYEFELGYEQFITRKTSIIGGISYGIGKAYVRNIQGEILHEYNNKRYSIFGGVRSRLLNKGKFSLFGELHAGVRREAFEISRPSINTLGFVGTGFGAEYRFTDRIKGTTEITSQYNSTAGLETSFNLGFQIGFGKKK